MFESHIPDDDRQLVSVIVRTCAGRGELLKECLRSIDAQEYRKIEVVVVEDGSAESQASVARFGETTDLAVQFLGIAKVGRCVAGNTALAAANGSLLNFLDDDDQFYPNHVRVLEAKLRNRPDLVAAYTRALEVPIAYQSLEPLVYSQQPGRPFRGGPFSLGRLWCQNFLPIQSIMFRRELFQQHGGFDPELDRLEDWNLWMRYLSHGDAEFIDEVTSFFRVPISQRSQLQRNAEIDAYYALAVRKQRDLFAQLSPSRQESLSREIEQYRLTQMAIPGRVRHWLDRNPFSRSAALKGMAFAKRVLRLSRRAAALAFRSANPARFPQ